MADHSILFSAPMVRAIIREIENPGTGKTQTRRIIKPRGYASLFDGSWTDSYVLDPGNAEWRQMDVRVRPGDRLWVREAWRAPMALDKISPRYIGETSVIAYEASESIRLCGKLRPSMFMPRWASRITLYVTDVRVQRLQDISEEDAVAEGVEPLHQGWFPYGINTFMTTVVDGREVPAQCCTTALFSYEMLWNYLNGRESWPSNPWVAAYSFVPILGNIDTLPTRLQEVA